MDKCACIIQKIEQLNFGTKRYYDNFHKNAKAITYLVFKRSEVRAYGADFFIICAQTA